MASAQAASTAENFSNAPSGLSEVSAAKAAAPNQSFTYGAGSSVRKGSGGSQAINSGTSARNSSRSWKDMLEIVKKLHNNADSLQEKISHLHCDFADLTLRAACLFDGTTVQILNDDYPEIGGIPSPEAVHFARQEVDDAYADLSQILSLRESRAEPEL